MPTRNRDRRDGFDRTSPAEGVRTLRMTLEGEKPVASGGEAARERLAAALARLEEDYRRALAFAGQAREVTGRSPISRTLQPPDTTREPSEIAPARGKARTPAKPRRRKARRSRKT